MTLRMAVLWGLIGISGAVIAEDAEAPDLEFLEYLGSWEASDEDWVVLATDAIQEQETARTEQGKDSAPDGEKLAEIDDEN